MYNFEQAYKILYWGQIVNILEYSVRTITYIPLITNMPMATAQNFEVISDEFSVIVICISGNYVQYQATKLCKY